MNISAVHFWNVEILTEGGCQKIKPLTTKQKTSINFLLPQVFQLFMDTSIWVLSVILGNSVKELG